MMLSEEQKRLVEENHNLIYSFLQKHHLSIDECYDLAAIGLCKAAQTYDEDKSNFSTYTYKCMFTTVMCELRKDKKASTIPEHQIVYYQAELNDDDGHVVSFMNYIPSEENVAENVLSDIIFAEYAKKLNDRDKKIFLLFREGYKQREIGEMLGCSQPQVSRIKRKLCEYLAS